MLRLVLFTCCVVLCVGYPNCGLNEEMQCVQSCPPEKTCKNRDIQFSCIQVVQPCHNVCTCKPGFVRNAVGDCITHEECDMCQAENEYFSCGSACDNECATLATQNKTNCPIVNIVCNRKCYCEDGFARDKDNKCVPVEQCHDKLSEDGDRLRRNADIVDEKCEGENEFFNCGRECDNECATLATQNRTNCPIVNFVCNPKCYCKDGFARNKDNKCIPVEQCDESRVRRYADSTDETICKGENEVYSQCSKSCPPNTCLSLVARFKCDSKEPCKKGCVCKPGYLRQYPDSPCRPLCECTEMRNAPECK